MNLIGIFGAGAVLLVGCGLVLKFFPDELAHFLQRTGGPSESTIKQQSAELLAKMERNVAERKTRAGR